MKNNKSIRLSASLMCADILNLGASLSELKKADVDYIHIDIMDGHFVPNLMLSPQLVSKTRAACDLPYDWHLMTDSPERIIDLIEPRKGDIVSVHAESTVHIQRLLSDIKKAGALPAVALNPATPLSFIEEIMPDIDMVLIMTVNPGYAGQRLVPQTLDKISRCRKLLDKAGYNEIPIQADGNCSFENIPKMYAAGADNFVVGSSSLFAEGYDIAAAAEKIRASCAVL